MATNGFLVIDKPGGMTSRDVVNRVQKWFPRKTKIGHAGTLDPLATGVLVVCVGAATRLTELVQEMAKTYHSRFRFGVRSTTDDADGAVTATNSPLPTAEQIHAALPAFIGSIQQTPPSFSAAKLGGKRAYDLAREGHAVEIAPRTVRVDAIRVLTYEPPFLDVEIDCGKGTYIRSIARDLGNALGCGGMVETLRRTRIGAFRVEDGISLDTDPSAVKLLPMALAAANLEAATLDETTMEQMRHGQKFRTPASGGRKPPVGERVALYGATGELIGIGECDADEWIHASIVLNV